MCVCHVSDFNVPLKMKMAAVALSTNTTEARHRKKSMQKKHGELSRQLCAPACVCVCAPVCVCSQHGIVIISYFLQ